MPKRVVLLVVETVRTRSLPTEMAVSLLTQLSGLCPGVALSSMTRQQLSSFVDCVGLFIVALVVGCVRAHVSSDSDHAMSVACQVAPHLLSLTLSQLHHRGVFLWSTACSARIHSSFHRGYHG
jgi:hypothetical protein